MEHNFKKENIQKAGVIIALLLISFLLAMKSGFNFFLRGGTNPRDGDVFLCIGWLMHKGFVPYRDIFDHKGMFLYFLQYVAEFIDRTKGIWVIELLFLTASIFIGYKFARKFSTRVTAVFAILLTFSRYSVCGYGNCVEEYAILFQIISLYFFWDFYQNPSKYIFENVQQSNAQPIGKKNIFNVRAAITGVCFACVFFMKANLCAVWIVFCIAIAIHCIRQKYYSSLAKFSISFLAGSALVVVPIICYLIKNEALNDFIYDYFIFNRLYTSNSDRVNIETIANSFITFSNTLPFIAALVIMLFRLRKKDKYFEFDVVYLIYMLAMMALIAMSGQTYRKMEIAVLPMLLYPFSQLGSMIDSDIWRKNKISALVIGFFVIMLIFPSWSSLVNYTAKCISKYVDFPENKGFYRENVVMYIEENTSEEDQILVLGNECRIYLYTERLPATKYIFMPDPRIDEPLIEDYFSQLQNNLPKVIVKSHISEGDFNFLNYVDDKINDILEKNNYELVIDGGDDQVWKLN